EAAVRYLSAALQDDPSLRLSAERMEELLRSREDWGELQKHYCQRAKQLGPETGDGQLTERIRVWSVLGELCLTKLDNREGAAAALEVAAQLEPENVDRRRRLADLYVEAGPDYLDKAVEQHHVLLRANKPCLDSYRALERLYRERGQTERSSTCAEAVSFFEGKPGDELPSRFQTAARALDQASWDRLR